MGVDGAVDRLLCGDPNSSASSEEVRESSAEGSVLGRKHKGSADSSEHKCDSDTYLTFMDFVQLNVWERFSF